MSLFKTKAEVQTLLPQSVDELDEYVADLINDNDLPDTNATYETIATLIMHMPPSVSSAPDSYFVSSVRKAIANKAAYEKLEGFRDERKAAAEALKLAETQSEPANVQSIQNPKV